MQLNLHFLTFHKFQISFLLSQTFDAQFKACNSRLQLYRPNRIEVVSTKTIYQTNS